MNRQCERKDVGIMSPSICNSCADIGSPCDNSLACLNICRPHYAPQDYQMSFILFQQQKNKKLLMSQSWPQPVTHDRRNHALMDYQMQLMLLEQQNMKRVLMARQQQYNMDQVSFQPSQHSKIWLKGPSYLGIQNACPSPSPLITEEALLQWGMSVEQPQPMKTWNAPNAYSGNNHLQDSTLLDPSVLLPGPMIEAAGQPDQFSQSAASNRNTFCVPPAQQ